jgi:hypothetical protein
MVAGASRVRLLCLTAVGAALVAPTGARAGDNVELRISKPAYEVGERVSFTLANDSAWNIQVFDGFWWRILDSAADRSDPCQSIPIMIDVLPTGWLDGDWDQIDCMSGVQVPKGRYRVVVDYQSECCLKSLQVEAAFEIGLSPVEPTTWGRVKQALAHF